MYQTSHPKKNSAIYNKLTWSSCEVPLFMSDFNKTLVYSIDFQKILNYQIP
jgi:hypothetical protein